jgi:hypothetical protein
MVYKFVIVSDEVDDFFREIQIDSEATFLDLHYAILKSVGYPDDQMTSFFLCEDNWEKREEITLEAMNTSSDVDSWVMGTTRLNELIEDEKQHLIYIFDPLSDRCFFIELNEIITGKSLKDAVCSKKGGQAPKQTIDFEQVAKNSTSLDVDENFYGDESFDAEDLDTDGFDMGNGGEGDNNVSIDTIDDLF